MRLNNVMISPSLQPFLPSSPHGSVPHRASHLTYSSIFISHSHTTQIPSTAQTHSSHSLARAAYPFNPSLSHADTNPDAHSLSLSLFLSVTHTHTLTTTQETAQRTLSNDTHTLPDCFSSASTCSTLNSPHRPPMRAL